jgi:hypothetical protein
MKIYEVTDTSLTKDEFYAMMKNFLVIAKEVLKLDRLPKIKLVDEIIMAGEQPSFGMYVQGKNILFVSLVNRHPIDILRTMAHELTHYKQDINNELNDNSGDTGSEQENEAHYMAGIIMRLFAKKYPRYMLLAPFKLQ